MIRRRGAVPVDDVEVAVAPQNVSDDEAGRAAIGELENPLEVALNRNLRRSYAVKDGNFPGVEAVGGVV